MSGSFERHARTVTLLTLVSRVTGLARDATLARLFGAGPLMDAFNFGFTVPNLFRRLFGEGALTASFLPVYARLDRDDPARARAFAGAMLGGVAVLLAAITLIGEAALALVRDSGADRGADAGIGIELLMIMLPFMPFVCLTALLGAVLQVHHRFGPTAASPILLNLAVVAAGLVGAPPVASKLLGHELDPAMHVRIVAASVVLAGAGQVLWSWLALRRSGIRLALRGPRLSEPIRETIRKVLPMLVGLGVFQLNTAVDALIASWRTMVGPTFFGIEWPLEEGSLTVLTCAQRLYEFPLGVFGVAVATAIFPAMARESHDAAAFLTTLRRGLRLTVFIGLPASAALVAMRDPLAATLFQGGRFTPEDSEMVAWVLLGYAPAIWAYSMQQVATRAFYALGDSMTPMRVALGMVVLNLALNLILIWTPLGVAGLAWSTAIAAIAQISILMALLSRRVGAVVDRQVASSWSRSLVCAVVTGAAVAVAAWISNRFVGAALGGDAWLAALVALAASTLSGCGAALLCVRLLGLEEFGWLLRGRPSDTTHNGSRSA